MISVVIPLYNKESTIEGTISSVLNQSFNDFEVIIVNDGSTDKSLAIVQENKDPRIRIITKENGGVSSARNVGIIEARFEYVAFIDADDFWYDNHLKTVVHLINKYPSPDVGGYGTRYFKSIKMPTIASTTKLQFGNNYIVENYFKRMSDPQPLFNSSSLTIKKSAAIEVGLFNENLTYMEDVEFWYRLFSKYRLAMSDNRTVIYYTGAANRSDINSTPLYKRFYGFDFFGKSKDHKSYLDKILCLTMLDNILLRDYNNVFQILHRYWRRLPWMTIYFMKLVKKRL